MYNSISWLTIEEYKTIMPMLANKCHALWEHENEVAKTGADLKNTFIGQWIQDLSTQKWTLFATIMTDLRFIN